MLIALGTTCLVTGVVFCPAFVGKTLGCGYACAAGAITGLGISLLIFGVTALPY